jgi:hypothetical protein
VIHKIHLSSSRLQTYCSDVVVQLVSSRGELDVKLALRKVKEGI